MLTRRLAVLLLVGLVDCAEGAAEHGSVSENGLSLNKLSLNKLSLNKLSLNKLSLDGLDSDGLAGLAASADGREVLTYVARCALREGDQLSARVDGVEMHFPGLLGLAPEWSERACDLTCQRWVSACLIAHGNGLGVSVPISLRGPHPALLATDDEQRAYPVQEGAFYGNVFTPTPGGSHTMDVCRGTGLGQILANPASDLRKRLCGILNDCPVDDAGSCGKLGDAQPQCEQTLTDGTYRSCWIAESKTLLPVGAEPTVGEVTLDDVRYDEVITVYLRK